MKAMGGAIAVFHRPRLINLNMQDSGFSMFDFLGASFGISSANVSSTGESPYATPFWSMVGSLIPIGCCLLCIGACVYIWCI